MAPISWLRAIWLLRSQDQKHIAEYRLNCRKRETWVRRKLLVLYDSHLGEVFPDIRERRPTVRFGAPHPSREFQSPSAFRGDSRRSALGTPVRRICASRIPKSQALHVLRLCSTARDELLCEVRTKPPPVFRADVLHSMRLVRSVAAAWRVIRPRHLWPAWQGKPIDLPAKRLGTRDLWRESRSGALPSSLT